MSDHSGLVIVAGGGGRGGGSGGVLASCSVTYTPTATGFGATITARYGGDSLHNASSDSQHVSVDTRSTSTSVSCTPNSVAVGQPATCTALVSDTAGSGAVTPTGKAFSSLTSGSGSISGTPCTLSGAGGSTSCSVTYTPSAADSGSATIFAQYSGDSVHERSTDQTTLNVDAFDLDERQLLASPAWWSG